MKRSRNLRMWLRPGMQIKRWLLLFILATVVTSLGMAMGLAWIYEHYDFPTKFQPWVEKLTLQSIPHPWRELLIALLGIAAFFWSLWKLTNSIISPLLAVDPTGRELSEIIKDHRFGPPKPDFNVVAIGGGTGLSALLRGLKLQNINLTAIVTVADDGGSTGRIRNVFNMPAPGDIRNCLVAMADNESLMGRLFHYRFDREGSELTGHAFGNLFITAMTQVTGSFEQGVTESARILNIRGRVLPSTLENITLCAEVENGEVVKGESALSHDASAIERVFIEPSTAEAYGPALAAILNADLIVLGPGSLYTSVLPNLLVSGIRQAIQWSHGATVYVCNVATQHGETDNFGYEEHVREVATYLGDGELDFAVVNTNTAAEDAIRPEWHVSAVHYDGRQSIDGGIQIVGADVVNDRNPLRHDPIKLSETLIEIARTHSTPDVRQDSRE